MKIYIAAFFIIAQTKSIIMDKVQYSYILEYYIVMIIYMILLHVTTGMDLTKKCCIEEAKLLKNTIHVIAFT